MARKRCKESGKSDVLLVFLHNLARMIWTKYLVKSKVNRENSLVFNTLSGAVDILPTHFLNEQSQNLPPDIFKQLIERGYLFKDKAEEEAYFEKIVAKQSNKVQNFVASLTFQCNLACTYCFEGSLTKRRETLSEEMVENISQAIKELKKGGGETALTLFGGEPLLKKNKGLVTRLIKISKKFELPVFIITNGIDLDYYTDLIKEYSDVIKVVQLTIDGGREFHDKRRVFANGRGTFDKIIDNLGLIADFDIHKLIRVNVDGLNINSLDNLADFVISKEWDKKKNIHFELALLNGGYSEINCKQLNEQRLVDDFNEKLKNNPKLSVFSVNQSKRLLGYLTDVLEQKVSNYGPRPYYCEACYGGSYVFAPDGFIYPCVESMGGQGMRIGRFVPKLELFETAKEWSNRTVINIEECRNCNLALVCGGGCAFKAAKEFGTPLKPHCGDAKKIFEDFMKKKAKELKQELACRM